MYSLDADISLAAASLKKFHTKLQVIPALKILLDLTYVKHSEDTNVYSNVSIKGPIKLDILLPKRQKTIALNRNSIHSVNQASSRAFWCAKT